MNSKLEKDFKQLDAITQNLFADLKKYPDNVLNKKPSLQAWSVVEILDHLMLAEEFSLKYLQKKVLDTSTAKEENLKVKWRWFLVKLVFAFNINFKAPQVVVPTIGAATLAEMETRWNAIRVQIIQLLQSLKDEDANKDLWKHAIAGKMNLYHMVEFLGMHLNRHKKQIERTLQLVK